jgi:RNA polymerase sigma factor for flagellar operon FliA
VCLDDLEAAGIPGLLAAIASYDPQKDVDFAVYAQPRIRGAILDELRELDPLPRSLREKGRRIENAIILLQQRLLRAPAEEEVADFLGMPLATFHHILHDLRGGLQVSLDAGWPNGDDDEGGEGSPPSLPEGRTPDPWRALALKQRQAILGSIVEELPATERTVLSLYYYEELTMKEIGAVLDVSESRVSQIHSAALLRIRARLRRRKLESEDFDVEGRRHHERSGPVRAFR